MEEIKEENKSSTEITQREYMRLYKRKCYAENPALIQAKNKAYYAKYKYGLTTEDMKKYDTLLPFVNRAKKALNIIKDENIDILKEVLNSYLEEFNKIDKIDKIEI